MNKKLQLLIITITATLVLTGCGGEEETTNITDAGPGKIAYETTNFFTFIPEDWEILEKKDLPSDAPSEFIVAFKNNIKHDIFNASVGITKDTFPTTKTSEDFMIGSSAAIKTAIVDYNEISAEENILVFEGKKSATAPIVHFKAVYIMNGNNGYTVTSAYVPDEDESVVNMTNEMLNSFTLK